ncbi:MAG: right-handed parallel beta-helix repeat-containing protein, partial [Lachnospiraceae bacterium]|nr:right-handed parallel beta-helix repeat-containing protein [Lachnospiraceae bacterium]
VSLVLNGIPYGETLNISAAEKTAYAGTSSEETSAAESAEAETSSVEESSEAVTSSAEETTDTEAPSVEGNSEAVTSSAEETPEAETSSVEGSTETETSSEEGSTEEETEWDGTYYGSLKEGQRDEDGYYIMKVDDFFGLKAALTRAKSSSFVKEGYTGCKVVCKPGTYYNKAALCIYSNTYLYAEDCVFLSADEDGSTCTGFNLLKVGNASDNASLYHYHDITISGGVFDNCGSPNTILKAAHAKDILLKNVTFKNITGGHMIEIAGVARMRFDHCGFYNCMPSEKCPSPEAIQVDVLARSHISGYKILDPEVSCLCKWITVENCVFDNMPRAIGAHTGVNGCYYTHMYIRNNRFTNISGNAIICTRFRVAEITGNYIRSGSNCIYIQNMTDTTYGFYNPDGYGPGSLSSDLTISGNDMASTNGSAIFSRGIYLQEDVSDKPASKGDPIPAGSWDVKGITVKNNRMGSSCEYTVSLAYTNASSIINNTITSNQSGPESSDPVKAGVVIRKGSSGITITSNTISGNYKRGIYIAGADTDPAANSAASISSNKITDLRYAGIEIKKSSVASIKNNQITGSYRNELHAPVPDYRFRGILLRGANVSLTDNIINACLVPIGADTATTAKIYYNNYSSNKINKVEIAASYDDDGIPSYDPQLPAVYYSAPSRVTKVSAMTETDGTIRLSWAPSPTSFGYQVYRSASRNGTYKRLTTITDAVSTSASVAYADTSAVQKTAAGTLPSSYYYKVRCYSIVPGYKSIKLFAKCSSIVNISTKNPG